MIDAPQSMPCLIAVAAMTSSRVIGMKGGLPWSIPEDLAFFKKLTTGHTVAMGRKTFESIGKPLPNRRNIILSNTLNHPPTGTELHNSVDEFLKNIASQSGPIFIIGGAQIYSALIEKINEIFLTYIYTQYEGDAYFPQFEEDFKINELILKNDSFEIRHYRRV